MLMGFTRETDLTPENIIASTPSITAWFEAAYYADDMTDDGGGLISQWNDHLASGSVADNATATGNNRPTYNATGLNGGFPTLEFGDDSGTKNFLASADSADWDHDGGFDLFLVIELDAAGEGVANRSPFRRYTNREKQILITSGNVAQLIGSTTGASSDINATSTVTLLGNNKALIHAWWDSTNMGISVNSETDVTASAATLNSPVNTTNIGALTTSSGSLQGNISALIYSKTKLSVAKANQIKNYLYCKYWNELDCIAMGQSLAAYYFTRGGDTTLKSEGGLYFRPDIVRFYNGAVGSSYLLKATATLAGQTDYWWDEDNGVPGSLLDDAIALVPHPPKFILWSQGEADRSSGALTSKAQYKDALEDMFAYIHSIWPDTKILIQKIGTAISIVGASNNKDRNAQWVREAQLELISSLSYVYFMGESFDLAMSDDVHPTSFSVLGKRLGRRCAELDGYTVLKGTVGPSLVSATATGASALTATISHDAGTDFTPTTGISGFVVISDGVINNVATAVRASATTINITTDSALGVSNTLYYIYGMMSSDFVDSSYDYTQVLKDNSANNLPLQAGHVLIA